jgi:hypothetical protein
MDPTNVIGPDTIRATNGQCSRQILHLGTDDELGIGVHLENDTHLIGGKLPPDCVSVHCIMSALGRPRETCDNREAILIAPRD